MLRAVVAGHRVRVLLLQRRLRAEAARDRGRTLGFVVLGVGFGVLVFLTAFFGGWFAIKKNAPELITTGTVAGLWGMGLALVFSSLGHAAQAFFSARDLWLWESAPTGAAARFIDRSIETAVAALPPTLALGTIGLAGLQLGGGGGVLAALRAIVAVVVIAPVPVAIGVVAAHVGGAVLPAGRLRRLSLVVVGVALTIGLVWFRRLRVERMLTEEGAAELLGAAKSVGAVGPALLPPRQLAGFVVDGSVGGFVVGVVGVVVAVLIAFATHVLLYRRARRLAVDESPTGVLPGSFAERAMRQMLRLVPVDLRPMVNKDLLAFVRDPGQWGQVILLLGVGVLYVVNASALGDGLRVLREAGQAFLTAMHVGIVAFIAGGLAARFAFPQVGLEGLAVWIVDGAPLAPRRLLLAKWWSAAPVSIVFPAVLGIAGGIVLDFGIVRLLWTTTLVVVCAVVFAGVGVARGARQPLFDATSLSELAMGPGAISTVIQATVLAGIACVAALFVEGASLGAARGYLSAGAALVVAVLAIGVPVAMMVQAVRGAFVVAEAALLARRHDGGSPLVASTAPVSLD
ncbi:MAG TPA: hypothetical protein VGF99_02850 [Myxococcota bacterium]